MQEEVAKMSQLLSYGSTISPNISLAIDSFGLKLASLLACLVDVTST